MGENKERDDKISDLKIIIADAYDLVDGLATGEWDSSCRKDFTTLSGGYGVLSVVLNRACEILELL
jgi:hypothetical protein